MFGHQFNHMISLEIPIGKRTLEYRLFEMLPAVLSYGAILLLVVLSMLNSFLAAIYLLVVIATLLIKAIGIAVRTIQGRNRLGAAQKVNWKKRLLNLEDPVASYDAINKRRSKIFGESAHIENLRLMSADSDIFPRPSQIYNAVIIATYNE